MIRVKSLSKSGNSRKDQVPNSVPQANKEVSSTSSLPSSAGAEDFNDQRQEKTMDMGRKFVERESSLYNSATDVDKQPSSVSSSYLLNGREEKGLTSASMDRERFEVKNSFNDYTSQKMTSYSQNDTVEKVQKVSPPRRKGAKEEKSERPANLTKRDANGSDLFTTSSKQQTMGNYSTVTTGNYSTVTTGSRLYEAESSPDGNISAVLEVWKICGLTCSLPAFN